MATIRVWHNNPKGDAYYYTFKSMAAAKQHARTHRTAQAPLINHKGREYTPTQWNKIKSKIPKIKRRKARPQGIFGKKKFWFQ